MDDDDHDDDHDDNDMSGTLALHNRAGWSGADDQSVAAVIVGVVPPRHG
jgi:hypothetical protein